jgi:RNA polymerase sigma factor (sigma-70 family)
LDRLHLQATLIRDRLVLANQALVVSIAKRHVQADLSLDELVSEALTPLLKAVEKFDATKGFKFSTYASWAIMKHFARIVPEHGQAARHIVSLGQEDLDLVLPGVADVDEAEAFQRSKAVQQALEELDDRERAILTNRFSLDRQGEPRSLSELGKELGVSKERVRQIESKAMDKLYGILKGVLGA